MASLRSGLITPGIDAVLLGKAARSKADLVHIELEDGVLPADKERARQTTRQALTELDWSRKLTYVRVNARDSGYLEQDVAVVVPARPTALLQGKCNGPEDIWYLDGLITRAEIRAGLPYGTVKIATMVERVRALRTIDELATASPRLVALYIGPSDLGNEYGYRRDYRESELETYWARSRVVMAAHDAGLLAIDSPSLYFTDLQATHEQSKWSYKVGFDLKTCVSPRQVDAVNAAFTPTDAEVEWARELLAGGSEARDRGRAVWASGGMMADAPFVTRAERILASLETVEHAADTAEDRA